jgi:hypothetical protein
MLICCGNTCNAHFSSHFFIPDSPTVSIMNMRPLDVVENVTLKLVCLIRMHAVSNNVVIYCI